MFMKSLCLCHAIGDSKTMKNIAEDAAVIKKLIVWTSERYDVIAQHHCHWLLSEPTAWKDLL
ncbi:hypothetical protein CA234_06925 [Sphingomonas sp. ABOLE]|nr:hypothetical protein CA234_06925 [Sphingomonas sp. ABOLE]